MRRCDRRGLGVPLTVVLSVVCAAACTAFAFLTLSSRSIGHAVRSAGAVAAEHAAESAVEDATFRFQVDSNDPSSPVFRKLRSALLTGSPAVLDLSGHFPAAPLLEHAVRVSPDREFHERLSIDSPTVTFDVATQRLHVEASASAPYSPHSRRTVRHERFVGMTPVYPLKPFDQCTFAILEYDFLKVLPDIVRETRRLIDLYNEEPILMQPWASIAESNRCAMPACVMKACCGCVPENCCGCPDAHCHRNPARKETRTWFFDRPQTRFEAKLYPCEKYKFANDWRPIPREALRESLLVSQDAVIFSTAPKVELETFEHEKTLEERYYPAIERLRAFADQFNAEIARAIGSTFCTDQHDQWHDRMMNLGREMRRELVAAAKVLDSVLEHLHRHSRPDLKTSTYTSLLSAEKEPARALALHLRDDREVRETFLRWPTLSGHLAWFGPTALRLEREDFQGKALVSSPPGGAGITVGRTLLSDPDLDRLVVWSEELTLEGAEIEASLFSNRRTRFAVRPAIRGNLILRHLIHRTQRGAEEDLRGQVEFDANVHAGPLAFGDPDGVSLGHLPIGVSPKLLRREVSP